MDARALALKAHEGQKYGSLPYLVHLERVVSEVQDYGRVAMDIAWLHDSVEDTDLTLEEISRVCGPVVALNVSLLTDPPGANRRERKALAYARLGMVDASTDEAWALLVKAADRLANVESSVLTGNVGLVKMYYKEQEAFRKAVYRKGWNDRFIEAIEKWLGQTP